MTISLRVPAQLRDASGGDSTLCVHLGGGRVTVADVFEAIGTSHPGVVDRVLDERSRLRRHVSVFIGLDNVRDLEGLATLVPDGAEITILPAVSGGCRARETARHGHRRGT